MPVAIVGAPYAAWIGVAGGQPDYRCTLGKGTTLPAGFQLLPTIRNGAFICRIASNSVPALSTGTSGRTVAPVQLVFIDSARSAARLVVNVQITIENGDPKIVPMDVTCRVGVNCGETLATASGGTPPYHYLLDDATGNTLPTGLLLRTDGKLTGKASSAGTYPISVCAIDANDKRNCAALKIGVTAASTFTPLAPQSPSNVDTPPPTPTPTQTITRIPGERLSINGSSVSTCTGTETVDQPSSVRLQAGEQAVIRVRISQPTRKLTWKFSTVTQVGYNTGATDFGTLTVDGCIATYSAPSNPGASLYLKVLVGVASEPTPTPTPTPSATQSNSHGGLSAGPASKPGAPAPTQSSTAPAESGPAAAGWLVNTDIFVFAPTPTTPPTTTPGTCTPSVSIYISGGKYGNSPIWIDGWFIGYNSIYGNWSYATHNVYIEDDHGNVLVNRGYAATCGLTLIKFT